MCSHQVPARESSPGCGQPSGEGRPAQKALTLLRRSPANQHQAGNKRPVVLLSAPCPPESCEERHPIFMADTSLVLNFLLVSSSGVIHSFNKRPSLAILTRISRTSSPRYMPLTIFSNLQEKSTRHPVSASYGSPLWHLMSGGDVKGEENTPSILTSAQSHWQARPHVCVSKQ